MITPIKAEQAQRELGQLLDAASVKEPLARYQAIKTGTGRDWLSALHAAGLGEGLDPLGVWAGKEAMIRELIWLLPHGNGKSNPAMLAAAHTAPALIAE